MEFNQQSQEEQNENEQDDKNEPPNNHFDGYLMFDFHEFQGLISQSDQADDKSQGEIKHKNTLFGQMVGS